MTILSDFRRYSVRTVDDPLAGRDFLHTIDENRPFGLEFLDHEAVVDDLLAHIDRWALSICSACLRDVSVNLAPLIMRAISSVRLSPVIRQTTVQVRPPDSRFTIR